jgi:predicted kinase
VAFLVMDLVFHGRRDLARAFAAAYLQAAGAGHADVLLPFYTAYRAVVRAKVDGFKWLEPEVSAEERQQARSRAQAYWLLALGELEEPGRKPCLVLVGGLPGTGKSTLAEDLAEHAGFQVIRSDVVRKELAGLAATTQAGNEFEQGLYSPERSEQTYTECLRRAQASLGEGKRTLIDAGFRTETSRKLFLQAARALAVPGLFLHCRLDAEVARQRLAARRGDASDADWAIYQRLAGQWEPPATTEPRSCWVVETGESRSLALEQALGILREQNLWS